MAGNRTAGSSAHVRSAGPARRSKLSLAQKAARRTNKPYFDGHMSETGVEVRLTQLGYDCWRNPGQRSPSVSTSGDYRPDLGARFHRLGRYGVKAMPNMLKSDRREANVIFEVKSQYVSGSVDRKIISAIDDLAYAADWSGAVPVLVLDTPVYSVSMMNLIKDWGDKSLVVVITREQLEGRNARRVLRSEIVRIGRDRHRMRKKIYVATGEVKRKYSMDTGTRASEILKAYSARHMRAMARDVK